MCSVLPARLGRTVGRSERAPPRGTRPLARGGCPNGRSCARRFGARSLSFLPPPPSKLDAFPLYGVGSGLPVGLRDYRPDSLGAVRPRPRRPVPGHDHAGRARRAPLRLRGRLPARPRDGRAGPAVRGPLPRRSVRDAGDPGPGDRHAVGSLRHRRVPPAVRAGAGHVASADGARRAERDAGRVEHLGGRRHRRGAGARLRRDHRRVAGPIGLRRRRDGARRAGPGRRLRRCCRPAPTRPRRGLRWPPSRRPGAERHSW